MSRAWDNGVCHETWIVSQDTTEPLKLPFVRDEHLRLSNGTLEDEYVTHLITAAREAAERVSWRPMVVTTYRMILSSFPRYEIVLRYPPLIEITSVTYVDSDGVTQTLTEDTDFYTVNPIGATGGRARIYPTYNTTWPAVRTIANAVTVNFTAGYVDDGSPSTLNVPKMLTDGMLLWIGERHKQRSLSVHAFNQTPAVLQAESIWKRFRAY